MSRQQALAEIIGSKALSPDERDQLLQQLVKHVTLEGDSSAKAAVLKWIPVALLGALDESLRLALFEDVIVADPFARCTDAEIDAGAGFRGSIDDLLVAVDG